MDTKQVIVIRKDLKMRRGKEIAQGSHASLKVFFDLLDDHQQFVHLTGAMRHWMTHAFRKICVTVDSKKELVEIYSKARQMGIPCSLIVDAGHTEFGGVPTKTAVAIGPDWDEQVDKVTGDLKLY